MSAIIELPEAVTHELVERAFARSKQLIDEYNRGGRRMSRRLAATVDRGLRLADGRNDKLLKFLERAAERLRQLNDAQQDRLEEGGFARTDYTEFATWRAAYRVADEGRARTDAQVEMFRWIYAACADALFGQL
jgi:hypothetical protein